MSDKHVIDWRVGMRAIIVPVNKTKEESLFPEEHMGLRKHKRQRIIKRVPRTSSKDVHILSANNGWWLPPPGEECEY